TGLYCPSTGLKTPLLPELDASPIVSVCKSPVTFSKDLTEPSCAVEARNLVPSSVVITVSRLPVSGLYLVSTLVTSLTSTSLPSGDLNFMSTPLSYSTLRSSSRPSLVHFSLPWKLVSPQFHGIAPLSSSSPS